MRHPRPFRSPSHSTPPVAWPRLSSSSIPDVDLAPAPHPATVLRLPAPQRSRLGLSAPAVAILVIALALRAHVLVSAPFWVDEAESSINALTILDKGYPADHFLGMPLFENMLIRPWHESREYEFKDVSYSDRGVAVYHAWIPLYAIAASFAAFGVEPPRNEPGWKVRSDVDDLRWRTLAARMPSVLFSLLFLVALYRAGESIAGEDVGLAALVLAGLSSSIVTMGNYARYYAATLAFSAMAAVTLTRLLRRGNWRDHSAHGLVLVLLFHTHLFAFVSIVVITGLAVLMFRRSLEGCLGLAVLLVVTAAACLPWFVLSGFASHLRHVAAGPSVLEFPRDLLDYANLRVPYLVVYSAGIAWLALVYLLHGRQLPRRLCDPWQRHGKYYVLLMTWMAAAALVWFTFTPPASAWPDRLSLCLFVPGLLMMAFLLADTSRMLTARYPALVAPMLAAVFLVAGGRFPPRHEPGETFEQLAETLQALDNLHLKDDARVYAAPNSHLTLTFYASKPIQSLAPVRKSFLDVYPGEVVFIDTMFYHQSAAPTVEDVSAAAALHGERLSEAGALRWQGHLSTWVSGEALRSRVARVVPPLDRIPPFAQHAVATARSRAAAASEAERFERLPVFRGYRVRTDADVWGTFAYRLVDPASRMGARLNAADRLRHGTALLVPRAYRVLFYSPPAETHAAS